MSTVKNISCDPQDLPDGRLVRPGARASRVDLRDPSVGALIEQGVLAHVTKNRDATEGDAEHQEGGEQA